MTRYSKSPWLHYWAHDLLFWVLLVVHRTSTTNSQFILSPGYLQAILKCSWFFQRISRWYCLPNEWQGRLSCWKIACSWSPWNYEPIHRSAFSLNRSTSRQGLYPKKKFCSSKSGLCPKRWSFIVKFRVGLSWNGNILFKLKIEKVLCPISLKIYLIFILFTTVKYAHY